MRSREKNRKPIIGITMGDPAGVGPEIVLKSVLSREVREAFSASDMGFLIIGDRRVLEETAKLTGADIELRSIHDTEELSVISTEIPLWDTGFFRDTLKLPRAKVSPLGGEAAGLYIRDAVSLAKEGKIHGMVTAPLNKESLKQAGIPFAGHTEMLAALSESDKSYTVFSVDKLNIFFHTRHLSLKEALNRVDTESIVKSIIDAEKCMHSIGYTNVKIALAALNPHASNGGLFGEEERVILEPACLKAEKMGMDVHGPIPADSVFYLALNGEYDIVVSLYHDQGHIAAKTYDFYRTVSITFGLPFIRTSPDHGTAFDIAWKGVVNHLSMKEAILCCINLARKYIPF